MYRERVMPEGKALAPISLIRGEALSSGPDGPGPAQAEVEFRLPGPLLTPAT